MAFIASVSLGTWIAAAIAAVVAAAVVILLSWNHRFRRLVRTAALDPGSLRGRKPGAGALF